MTQHLLLFIGGLAAGFINTLASSGSAVSLPIFLFLGFAPHVKGLAGYLRNRNPVPPLTSARNAPWGGGKSSVMRMLRTEMRSATSEAKRKKLA